MKLSTKVKLTKEAELKGMTLEEYLKIKGSLPKKKKRIKLVHGYRHNW